MNLKTALMALAMGTLVFGNVGCGNACDEAADLAADLCPSSGGGSDAGGGTAEDTCSESDEAFAQCVIDKDPADCDALGVAFGECLSDGGGGAGG